MNKKLIYTFAVIDIIATLSLLFCIHFNMKLGWGISIFIAILASLLWNLIFLTMNKGK